MDFNWQPPSPPKTVPLSEITEPNPRSHKVRSLAEEPPPDWEVPGRAPSKRKRLKEAIAEEIIQDVIDPTARGVVCWRWLTKHPPPQWPNLVVTLTEMQRDSLILHLCSKGHAPMTVADKLGLSPIKVQQVWRENAELIGDSVMGITLPQILGRIEARCEAFTEAAIRDGRPDRAWKFEKERIEILQDLGVVDRAAKKHEHMVQHRLTQEGGTEDKDIARDAEIQRLVELKEMRARSLERSQRLVTAKVDAIPVGTNPEEDEE